MGLKVLTVTNNIEATRPLINSLEKNEWNAEILVIPEWKGFGTKLLTVYEYLKSHPEVTEFIFMDAFDTVALGCVAEFKEKIGNKDMLLSAERGCWPVPFWEPLYTNRFEHGFNYVNSGLYYSKSSVFIGLFENDTPTYETDDQMWMTKQFLDEGIMIGLDTDCDIFQSHSFIQEDDYLYGTPKEGRVFNRKTNTFPICIHFNGRSPRENVDNLLK